jgi:hypothetical protein
MTVDQLPRTELSVSRNRMTAGAASRKIGRGASNDELLDAYLDFVRSMRQVAGQVHLRDADLGVLATVLSWSVDDVRGDLERRMTAVRLERRRRRSRRAVFAAFGVGVVSSALVVLSPSGPGVASSGAPKIGSALSIERTVEGHVVELHRGQQVVGQVIVGDAQVITHA